MRPKLSKQVDAQGAFRYTYLCAMKEKSRSHCCQVKNASGNALDKAVYVEIKKLGEDGATFIQQLALGKKKLANSPPPHHECLERWRATLTEQEQEIAAYVTSLAKASGTSAEDYIVAQIDRLHINVEMVRNRIATLENITANRELSKDEFDMLCQRLSSTKDMLDDMSVTCKREAVRTLVKKVVWDGEHAHLYFFDLSGNLCISSDENPLKPVFSPPLV